MSEGRAATALAPVATSAELNALAQQIAAPWLPDLLHRAKALADGVTAVAETKLCGRVVYEVPPDRKAIQYLIDRLLGRPTTRIEADITIEQVEYLFEQHAETVRLVLTDELGAELAHNIAERITRRLESALAGSRTPGLPAHPE